MQKRLSRVSVFDQNSQSYGTSAYLIAQLGKNYSLLEDSRISGEDLIGSALNTISDLKYRAGGLVEFIEFEQNDFLTEFYTTHGFSQFDTRVSHNGNQHTLVQFLKFI